MSDDLKITLAHGAGGLLSHILVKDKIASLLANPSLSPLNDASTVKLPSGEDILISTDSFVVDPCFFPGGDIGKLSICGSVNDILVSGGRPICVSLAMIIEEGFLFDRFDTILSSVKKASVETGAYVATGDTKVVPKGTCGGIYINTTAVGVKSELFLFDRGRIMPGDVLIVTGTIAEHGFAILSARNNLMVNKAIQSDCACLSEILSVAEKYGEEIKFMRDPTRGGLAAVLNEIVEDMPFGICVEQEKIPISPAVRALSEILGIDPLSVASEGRAVIVCSEKSARCLLSELGRTDIGATSEIIGTVTATKGRVYMKTSAGVHRIIDMPVGEIVPRIC